MARTLLGLTLFAGGLGLGAAVLAPPTRSFEAVFWQPDCASLERLTDYRAVGAQTLIVQWTALPGEDFSGTGTSGCRIDWADVQARSGNLGLVLGLAGHYDPRPEDFGALAQASVEQARRLSAQVLSPALQGYYAPVELHPDLDAAQVQAYLAALPRPLWVSAYAGPGQYNAKFVAWLREAVPKDVHLLVQDGVGVGHATPLQAAAVVRALRPHFGADGVSIVVEVFRRTPTEKFRSALPWELDRQLQEYGDLRRVAFDGGHYMGRWWLGFFRAYSWLVPHPAASRLAAQASFGGLS